MLLSETTEEKICYLVSQLWYVETSTAAFVALSEDAVIRYSKHSPILL